MANRPEGFSIEPDGVVSIAVKDGDSMVVVSAYLPPDHMRAFAAQLVATADVLEEAERAVAATDVLNRNRKAGWA